MTKNSLTPQEIARNAAKKVRDLLAPYKIGFNEQEFMGDMINQITKYGDFRFTRGKGKNDQMELL